MEFLLKYKDVEYLISVLDEYERKDGIEVLRLPYGKSEDDWVEYQVTAHRLEGDKLLPIKVLNLPKGVRDELGKYIDKILDRTFIANPYFDEILVFPSNEVFSYQSGMKPVKCDHCSRANLYEKVFKENKQEYVKRIKQLLERNANNEWPFNEKLRVQFTVSNLQSRLDKVDLDNLAKTILDVLKGTVYSDDNQIVSLAGSKASVNNIKTFIVAVKRLEQNEVPTFQNHLWSNYPNAWKEERKIKEEANKPTRFYSVDDFRI